MHAVGLVVRCNLAPVTRPLGMNQGAGDSVTEHKRYRSTQTRYTMQLHGEAHDFRARLLFSP